MRLITGDECGLLKECIPEHSSNPKNKSVRGDGDDDKPTTPVAPNNAMPHVSLDGVCRVDSKEIQTRKRGLVDLAFVHEDQLSFAALRQNGSIQLWQGDAESKKTFGKYRKEYETKSVFEKIESDLPSWKPLALGAFQKEGRLCAGDSLGNLSVVNLKNGSVVETYNSYKTSKGSKTISYTPGNNLNSQLATAMAFDPTTGRVAVGGRERETTVLDLTTGKVVFKAKNLPPDPQTLLQHPVWPTSILFLWDTNTMAVGTGYKELRLYDVRESSKVRRPIARSTSEGGPIEYRVTSLCQVGDFELAVGDAAGYIYSMDIRKLDKSNISRSKSENLGRYVGPAGSVRQLKKHPTLPRMAAVGLDRMLRVYDTNKRKELDCFYLKQRLTCVLFGSDDDWRPGSSSHGEGTADEDQDIDQDDLVQDYVDSDDGGDSEKDHADHVEENDNEDISVSAADAEESSNEEQDISRSFQEEEEDDDDSSQEDSSQDNSDLDEDDIPSVNTKESTEGSDESDEEVVVKAPTKKRRKR